ncbi:MAG TPA: gluconate 2-dehydrogenase subunit 3 family protein [Candidatus Sulfotelmatobacter sp.]|nr:gluconate 2-dehydrogenase subunit 3 family protein [Candidatus Sulfotelmatobacter sp.]
MKAKNGINRRRFMQLAAGAVAVGASVSCGKVVSPWRSLSVDEAETLSSLCGQIIPQDQDAGAVSAGVVNYIDVQLAGRLKRMKKVYRQGIAEMNDVSVKKYGRRFSGLSDQQQAEFLSAIDGDKEWKGSPLPKFFRIVIDHTMQGFYGDPRHGGNRNRVSWTMLRLPYPPIRGRFRVDDPVAGRE